MKITVTQFLRPNGRKKELLLEIPDSYQEQYKLIKQCGCYISCEQIQTGEAAQYITHKTGDFAIKVTPCFETADNALLEMIAAFNKDAFDKWLREQEADLQEAAQFLTSK